MPGNELPFELKCRSKLLLQSNMTKSLPLMDVNSHSVAEDDHIMALRFSRRCGTFGDNSSMPAPTRFRKSHPNSSATNSQITGLRRTQSQPTIHTSYPDLELIEESKEEIITLALKMVTKLIFFFLAGVCDPQLCAGSRKWIFDKNA